jgi:deoxycytidylate deaminase
MIITTAKLLKNLNFWCCFYRLQLEALKSNFGNYKLGSAILKKNKVLSYGYNKNKTHPKLIQYGYLKAKIHAEFDALIKSEGGDTLMVVRFQKDGSLSCSKPCKSCLNMAKTMGISEIIYSGWDGELRRMEL